MLDEAIYTPQQVKDFQQLLLHARRTRGLTQVEAANAIGVSQTMISNLERGPQPGMRVGELFKVLAYYHIEPNRIAEVLGYWDEGSIADANVDPRFVALMQGLTSLPNDLYDQILTAIEMMLRGASKS